MVALVQRFRSEVYGVDIRHLQTVEPREID